MSDLSSIERESVPFAPLLWAVFLGVSWTWVIGMFMPVLLVRDFGALAWVVFVVPNVIGAAAMGWVLRDSAASERFVQRHAVACRAFSLVTIAFHMFFATWLVYRIGGAGGVGSVFVTAVFLGAALLAAFMRGSQGRWVAAAFVLAVSLAVWNDLYGRDALAIPPVTPIRGHQPPMAAWYLAPAFLVGFALNPYLDLTFHRARQATSPAGGRLAFGLGFGVVFCSMIVFTLLYARFLYPAVDGRPLSRVMSVSLLIHLAAQIIFTMAAHFRELPRKSGPAAFAIYCAAILLGLMVSTSRTFRGRDAGEVIYWCFLGFYGVAFPAYVWLCATGRGGRDARSQSPVSRRALGVLAGVVVIVIPMYWMAFVEGRPFWLVPGALVILLSRLLVPRPAQTSTSGAGDEAETPTPTTTTSPAD